MDTSFDFSERILYVCIVIFRMSHVAKRLFLDLIHLTNMRYIHTRKLSRKSKNKLFSVLERLLERYRDDIVVRIIGLNIRKGTNRFRKYAFIEKLISQIAQTQKFEINNIIVPTDLNTGNYKLCDAIRKRLNKPVVVVEENTHYCVQIADAIINLYRHKKELPTEFSYSRHNC